MLVLSDEGGTANARTDMSRGFSVSVIVRNLSELLKRGSEEGVFP
jgi:hypothetical protein